MPFAIRRSSAQVRCAAVTLFLATTGTAIWSVSVFAQSFSPYSDLQAMSLADLATLQVKLSYLGDQTRMFTSRALTASGNVQNLSFFVPFERPAFDYANDHFTVDSFKVAVEDLKALIDSVGTIPEVTDGGVDAGGYLSFALLNSAGGTTKAFESLLDRQSGRKLFRELLEVLGNYQQPRESFTRMACLLGVMEGTPATDVSSQVTVRLRGMRLDRRTGQFVGKMQLTNMSGNVVPAPAIVALYPRGSVRLVAPDGFTSCAIAPAGMPYKNLPVGGGLQPGQQVTIVVRFDNPDRRKIEFDTVRVLAGAGMR